MKKALLALPVVLFVLAGIVITGCPVSDPDPIPEGAKNWSYTTPSQTWLIEKTESGAQWAKTTYFPIFPVDEKYSAYTDWEYEITFEGTTDTDVDRLTAGLAEGDWLVVDWAGKQNIKKADGTKTLAWSAKATGTYRCSPNNDKNYLQIGLLAEDNLGEDNDKGKTVDVTLTGTFTVKVKSGGDVPGPDEEGFIDKGTVELKANTWDGGGNWQTTLDANAIMPDAITKITNGKTYTVTIKGTTDVALEEFKVAFINGDWQNITTYSNPARSSGEFTQIFTVKAEGDGVTAPPDDLGSVKLTLVNEKAPTVEKDTVVATITGFKIKVTEQ